jgi:hypothetical protein
MQVEGYRGSEQGLGVAARGIRCRATSAVGELRSQKGIDSVSGP